MIITYEANGNLPIYSHTQWTVISAEIALYGPKFRSDAGDTVYRVRHDFVRIMPRNCSSSTFPRSYLNLLCHSVLEKCLFFFAYIYNGAEISTQKCELDATEYRVLRNRVKGQCELSRPIYLRVETKQRWVHITEQVCHTLCIGRYIQVQVYVRAGCGNPSWSEAVIINLLLRQMIVHVNVIRVRTSLHDGCTLFI